MLPPGSEWGSIRRTAVYIWSSLWLPSCHYPSYAGGEFISLWVLVGSGSSFPLQVEDVTLQILVFPACLAAWAQAWKLISANLTHFPDSAWRVGDEAAQRNLFQLGWQQYKIDVGVSNREEWEFWLWFRALFRSPQSLIHQPFWQFCDLSNILFYLYQPDGSCYSTKRPLSDK